MINQPPLYDHFGWRVCFSDQLKKKTFFFVGKKNPVSLISDIIINK